MRVPATADVGGVDVGAADRGAVAGGAFEVLGPDDAGTDDGDVTPGALGAVVKGVASEAPSVGGLPAGRAGLSARPR